MNGRTNGKPWQPGRSGNPAGRKPGTGKVAKLREAIEVHVPEIIAAMVKKATEGDVGAARLLMERSVAPRKSEENPVEFPLPDGSLTDKGRAVLQAASDGRLTPDQASKLLAAIGSLARTSELDELAARVAALEVVKNA